MLDKIAAGLTFSLNRQPAQAVRIGIELDGCTVQAGASATITGDAGSEVVQLNDNARFLGALFFTNVSGITIGGVRDGFVDVKSLNSQGQPVNQDLVISASMRCRFFYHEGKLKVQPAGQMESGKIMLLMEPNADVVSGDIITSLYGLEQVTVGRAIHIDPIFDFDGLTHHVEAELNNIQ